MVTAISWFDEAWRNKTEQTESICLTHFMLERKKRRGGEDEDVRFAYYTIKCVKKYLFVSRLTIHFVKYTSRVDKSASYVKPSIDSFIHSFIQ